ncbi:hypothetical protein Pmar_PMAR016771 [Perkinsus marinus ATCC 50983]|uniref:Uncharacterized protein n=1 Tax=Perkinsus marinus (strain ATCC 50983 / TXsc) TaxID=423536 RepID=C5LKS5_PERM5|nr:hypothetical protein Pmar_PMAR016771 [Perkinsus marinus ATCC 50983]EER02679.1 hypothetical protein Pmar_PMAR016771 [Perkinsus marinus ATCC 50983]|eukprot:XP_002769982.1 hypothetical protein Pmar_PMAR016771 [Perkinsus marinus ATCC 50983]
MNLPADAADILITKMRTRIFVETKNLVKKDLGEVCSSLSGPSCHFERVGGNTRKTSRETTLVGGVIPDHYISDSPGFDALAAAMPYDVWEFDPTSLPDLLLPPPVEKYEGKMLDLKQQAVGRRGRWLVDDSYRAEKGTSLPTYIRFSKPVLARKIWIELDSPIPEETVNVKGEKEKEKVGKKRRKQQAAIVILRRGTETVWSSRMLIGSTTVDLHDAISGGYELEFGNSTGGPLTVAETVLGDESKSIITSHLLKLLAANDEIPLELRRELEGRKDEVEELAHRVLTRIMMLANITVKLSRMR